MARRVLPHAGHLPRAHEPFASYVHEPVVEDDGVITAPATASLEFAKHLLEKLQVYSKPALDAWYALYRTGRPDHYFAFVEALKRQAA